MEDNELMTEETTPMEEATVQDVEGNTETTPQEEVETETGGTQDTETEEVASVPEELFSIRYMHKDLEISKDEAKRLAQKGKHYEDNVEKTLESLDYVAALQGKTVQELVEALVSGVDSAKRQELIEELGADNPLVDELLELHKSKNNKAYEATKAEREAKQKQAAEEAEKSVTTKLAEQFEGVREIFPEYDTIEKVPDMVLKKAIKSGDLEKELLRYRFTEAKKVEAAKASQEKNKKESIGSVASDTAEDNLSAAFSKGVWG